jgi:hypothetical protein
VPLCENNPRLVEATKYPIYRCLKIREFRIQRVVGKHPVEFEKYLEKKIALPEEDISTLILFNRQQPSYPQ